MHDLKHFNLSSLLAFGYERIDEIKSLKEIGLQKEAFKQRIDARVAELSAVNRMLDPQQLPGIIHVEI
jgi:hypothetical protein